MKWKSVRMDERRCSLVLPQLTSKVVVGVADVCENLAVCQRLPDLERPGVSGVAQSCVKGHLCFRWESSKRAGLDFEL